MPIRYDCDLEGFDGCFVEYSERWTRGEMRRVWEEEGEKYWALVQSKITACNLGTVTDPAALTVDGLDSIDWVLFRWFSATILKALGELQTLGESAGRRLFEPSEESEANPTP